ncbi:hypothetical protein ['Camptotheca acuminata' phytoplasma]|uniref:hypothetical protein n=1 Tax='Camptotheca acuminata' phytoplasma TaxID=3239192 RepID=UPI003519DE0F
MLTKDIKPKKCQKSHFFSFQKITLLILFFMLIALLFIFFSLVINNHKSSTRDIQRNINKKSEMDESILKLTQLKEKKTRLKKEINEFEINKNFWTTQLHNLDEKIVFKTKELLRKENLFHEFSEKEKKFLCQIMNIDERKDEIQKIKSDIYTKISTNKKENEDLKKILVSSLVNYQVIPEQNNLSFNELKSFSNERDNYISEDSEMSILFNEVDENLETSQRSLSPNELDNQKAIDSDIYKLYFDYIQKEIKRTEENLQQEQNKLNSLNDKLYNSSTLYNEIHNDIQQFNQREKYISFMDIYNLVKEINLLKEEKAKIKDSEERYQQNQKKSLKLKQKINKLEFKLK